MSEHDIKRHREMIEEILDQGTCSKWEDSFCVSLVDQLDRGRALSERQTEILERIHQEKMR